MKPLPRLLGAILALVSVFWSLPQGLLVLCAGEDGHLAVEFLHPAEQECGAQGVAAWTHDCTCPDCGPCQDTRVGAEISASRVPERRQEGRELRPLGPPQPGAIAARFCSTAPRAVFVERGLPAPGWIRHQETLRLLI